MDRFNSTEDLEFHPEYESQGRLARLYGEPLSNNPFDEKLNPWLAQSWAAGWADADMDENAPKDEIDA